VSSPDHTPEAIAPEHPAADERRLREKVSTAFRELRATFTGTGSGAPHRLPPGLRTAQIGAAAVATGVLGVVLGAATPAPDAHADTLRTAPEAAGQVQPGPVPPPSIRSGLGAARASASLPSIPGLHGDRDTPKAVPAPQDLKDLKDLVPKAKPAPQVPAGDQLDQWIAQATAVLERNGVPRDQINPDAMRTIIEHESGGDPGASNNWDSNAAAGTPSKGLMQTIDPTFQSYAVPGHQDIWNPVDNIVAGTRYSIDRYGSMQNVPGVAGLSSGGSYQGY